MDLNKVGKFIAENRKLRDLTQNELGELLGINSKTISKWERGVNAPDIALLTDIAKYLNITVEELLAGEKRKHRKFNIKNIFNNIINKSNKTLIIVIITFIIFAIFMVIGITNIYKIVKSSTTQIYKISTDNEEYSIHGYLFLNNDNYSVNITEIKSIQQKMSRSIEKEFDNLEIDFVSNGKILYNYSILEGEGFSLLEELKSINIEFNKKPIERKEDIIDVENYITIKCCTNDNECSVTQLDLSIEIVE